MDKENRQKGRQNVRKRKTERLEEEAKMYEQSYKDLTWALKGGGTIEANARLKELREQDTVECTFYCWVEGTSIVAPCTHPECDNETGYDDRSWPTDTEILTLWRTFKELS